jgi:hypothetical protein
MRTKKGQSEGVVRWESWLTLRDFFAMSLHICVFMVLTMQEGKYTSPPSLLYYIHPVPSLTLFFLPPARFTHIILIAPSPHPCNMF